VSPDRIPGTPRPRDFIGSAVVVLIVVAIVFAVIAFVTSTRTVGRQEVLLVYGGRTWLEPAVNQYKKTVGPGGRHNVGLANNEYSYPVTQRDVTLAASGGEGGIVPVSTKSASGTPTGTVADVTGTSVFRLNTDPATLRAFHERHGLKFKAWEGIDGTDMDTGWVRMLQALYVKNLQSAVNDAGGKFTYGQLQTSEGRDAFNKAVSARLFVLLRQNLGGDFFCNQLPPSISPEDAASQPCTAPGFLMDPLQIDEAVRNSAKQVEQATREAEAIKARAAGIKAAVKESGLTPDQWLKLQAINSGKATVVISDGTPVAVGSSSK
jgi:hypothetical protein